MGLTNEFIQYITTPEEYDRQHYEGGSTIYGPAEGAAISDVLVEMATGAAPGQAAPPSPTRSTPATASSPTARRSAPGPRARRRPPSRSTSRRAPRRCSSGRAARAGLDRRLDKRFISIQRRAGKRWRRVADDLGVAIVWTGDPDGAYDAHWQVPRRAKPGRYRVVVTANHYRLRSASFRVDPGAPALRHRPDPPGGAVRAGDAPLGLAPAPSGGFHHPNTSRRFPLLAADVAAGDQATPYPRPVATTAYLPTQAVARVAAMRPSRYGGAMNVLILGGTGRSRCARAHPRRAR